MKKLKVLIILGLIITALGGIGAAITAFASPAMIVSFGVRMLSSMLTTSYVVMGVGAAITAGGVIPAVVGAVKNRNNQKLIEDKQKDKIKNLSEYAKDSLNPQKTRVRLEQLRQNNPKLSPLVELCFSQLDKIDTYQARQKTLIDANEAIYLEDTIEILNESEKRMCRNFRNIINCCILIEDTNGDIGEIDDNIINSSLADNEEELNSVSMLLKYSVSYINNYNRNGVGDRSELDAWLKVMKNSVKDN